MRMHDVNARHIFFLSRRSIIPFACWKLPPPIDACEEISCETIALQRPKHEEAVPSQQQTTPISIAVATPQEQLHQIHNVNSMVGSFICKWFVYFSLISKAAIYGCRCEAQCLHILAATPVIDVLCALPHSQFNRLTCLDLADFSRDVRLRLTPQKH